MKKKITDQIMLFLKMRGEATATLVSEEHAMTKEGARQHLLNLAKQGLIIGTPKSEGVGRPVTFYSLTEKGLNRFPDTHAGVTVQLLQSVKKLLGENALDLLINDREEQVYSRYSNEMNNAQTLEEKLNILSKMRAEEGYMAEWKSENGAYFLIENHCPICAAARECQGFCRSELTNFRQLFGAAYQVERVEYILEDSNRCVYKISESH